VKTRFAPSPTGLLHFGNVRTALFNVLMAEKSRGVFLLRVEDTDAERSRDEYIRALQEDLTWLGLNWQEGEGKPGPASPYRQSQRGQIYEDFLQKLSQSGKVYSCFCSAMELEVSRKVQVAAGKPPRYSGKCAHLSSAEVANKLEQGLAHSVRFRMPKSVMIEFEDLVRGPQKFSSDEIGDFIIRRSDHSFSFFFVNAVDDALMGVTHVLRGEDHLTNTPRQLALLQALELTKPQYGHISLIVDHHGAPLSKRSGSMSVQELRELGYFPSAVNNYLARLGHHFGETELLDHGAMCSAFRVESLGRAPARYDRTQLDYWQSQAVRKADLETLSDWLKDAVRGVVPDEELKSFAAAIRDNMTFPQDARLWAQAIYSSALQVSEEAKAVLDDTAPDFFRKALDVLDADMEFTAFAKRVKSATSANGSKLFHPLRAALTGQIFGPELARVFPLIGFKRAQHRLAQHVLSTEID
jgi:glutamyl-tRNA synthetase